MGLRLRDVVGVLAVAVVSAFMALRPFGSSLTGDYAVDVAPAIDALLHGDVGQALAVQPLMGAFSVLVRMPFAALALLGDGSVQLVYELGAFPCVFAAGALGLFLAREMGRRGQTLLARVLVVAVLIASPLTVFVLDEGHPEELLGAALCVGALLAATRDRSLLAGLLLGLALATKQWALIAVAPVVLALGAERAKALLVAGSIAAVLTLPLLADPDGFSRTASAAQGVGHPAPGEERSDAVEVRPYTVWRLLAVPSRGETHRGDAEQELHGYEISATVARASHAAIVLLPIPLALLLWRRRHSSAREDWLLLLALAFLLRCLLDPIDGPYYHVPFVVALAAWEGLRLRGLPVASIVVSCLLMLSLHHEVIGPLQAFNPGVGAWVPVHVFYLAWAIPLCLLLAVRLYAGGVLSAFGARLAASLPAGPRLARTPIGGLS